MYLFKDYNFCRFFGCRNRGEGEFSPLVLLFTVVDFYSE